MVDGVGLVVVLFFAQGEPATATMQVNLHGVIERVRAHNPAIMAAREQARSVGGERQKAWTSWQPELSGIGQLMFNSVEAKFDFAEMANGLKDAFPIPVELDLSKLPPPTVISPHVQAAAMLTLRQTLFNITALRAPGVARRGEDAATMAAEAAEDELVFAAVSLYATLSGMSALDAAALRAIEVATKRVADAKVKVAVGTETKLAQTRAETDRVVAEGHLLTLRAQRKGLLATLAALMGTSDGVEIVPESVAERLNLAAMGSPDERASVRAKSLALDAADAAVGLSDLSWLPTLAADGALRYSNVEGFTGEKFVASATLNLVVPLYDRGVRYADTEIAVARAAAAREALHHEKLTAEAFLREAEAKLEAAEASLTQAQAQLRLATEAVTQVEALVNNGLLTSLDLTDADSKRFFADQQLIQKRVEVDLAKLRVHHARGGKLVVASTSKP